MKKTQKGFTLVEVIIVLVIIAILSVMLVPSLTGYIDNAKRSQVLAECKMATAAAQTLYGDYFASVNEITYDEIEDLAEVPGEVTLVARNEAVDKHVVVHLTYQNNGLTCTYCKYYSSCAEHDMLFSFSDGIGGEPGAGDGGGDNPGGTDPGGNVGGNEDYLVIDGNLKYETKGNIITHVENVGGWGTNLSRNDIYWWNGSHYIVATWNIAFYNNSNIDADMISHIAAKNVFKISTTITSPTEDTVRAGDVRMNNGRIEIFNPNNAGDINDDLTLINKWWFGQASAWIDITNKKVN